MGAGDEVRPPSGHVFRVDRARAGLVREAPAARWPPGAEERRPGVDRARAAGHRLLNQRTAEARLRDRLDEARRGVGDSAPLSGATFADAAAEWLRYIEHDRRRKPSTVGGYASIVRTQLPRRSVRWRSSRSRRQRSTRSGHPPVWMPLGIDYSGCVVFETDAVSGRLVSKPTCITSTASTMASRTSGDSPLPIGASPARASPAPRRDPEAAGVL